MNTRLLLGLSLASLVFLATGRSEPAQPAATQNVAAERLVKCSGLFGIRDEWFVCLFRSNGQSRWTKVGGVYFGNRVVSVDRANDKIYLNDSLGQQYALTLPKEKVGEGGPAKPTPVVAIPLSVGASKPSGPKRPVVIYERYPPKEKLRSTEGLDWAWIDSDDNPMRKHAIIPSGGEAMRWKTMTRPEKDDFVELYRQCGWDITVIDDNYGVGINYRKIVKPANVPKDSGSLTNEPNQSPQPPQASDPRG